MTDERGDRARLAGRRLALGVCGSIAAYKSVELLRLLQAEGADVRVLLTPSAKAFVGTLSLETLSRHPVDADVLALQPDRQIGHIDAANAVDAIVVAPATAHWLGAMANGLAADPITAACLATAAPVVVAPAMDGGMYAHPATQSNVSRLRGFGYAIVEPELGPLASGLVGQGRLASLERIVDAVVRALESSPPAPAGGADLHGRHVVVTAGGTAEPIDPVRFIGNRSSGKMGMAVASAALARGARVTLILGHVSVAAPQAATVVPAETAEAMQAALHELTPPDGPAFDALVMAAAVADFRPRVAAARKLSRRDGLTLELEATPDLLADVAARIRSATQGRSTQGRSTQGRAPARRPVLVGFAAETGSLERAAEKLRAKGVDLLVANDVAEEGSGFGTDTNRVSLYAPGRPPEAWPQLSKREVADRLLDRIAAGLAERDAAAAAAAPSPSPAAPRDPSRSPAPSQPRDPSPPLDPSLPLDPSRSPAPSPQTEEVSP